MADLGHDAVFVEEAAALRPRLEACARVLYPGVDGDGRPAHGDTTRADRAVDQALARTYVLAPDADPTIAAFRALLHPSWRPTWRAARSRRTEAERVELVDVVPARTGDLADDLAALGPTSEAIVVLALLGHLGPDELGRVVGVPAGRATELLTEAIGRLARNDPGRADPRELARQLTRLGGPTDPLATVRVGVGDLARGQRLQARGRRRRGVLAVAAAAVVALVFSLAVPGADQGEVANVPPTPTPTPRYVSDPWRSYGCDPSSLDCRSLTLARWRSRMSEVIVQHLDQHRRYFSEMSWGLGATDQSESFWRGEGGALAVRLSRFADGGTEVYLQIATDPEHADRCGQQLKKRCAAFESMDGNVYRVAGTSTSTGGVEVQFMPTDDRVITLVARNTSGGKRIDIDSGDLISLANDSRLRLPRR
jgi:hypothetical protein